MPLVKQFDVASMQFAVPGLQYAVKKVICPLPTANCKLPIAYCKLLTFPVTYLLNQQQLAYTLALSALFYKLVLRGE
jgi:hypothetical protein